ncbi:LysR family transcriptional regulator [Streptomyces sp. NPDC048241]|uniref:LysR family transcriptional regulator n=1 Tax=Streptomyces sp. NPDC048241 TaxID=3365521 RepID=UPI003711147B
MERSTRGVTLTQAGHIMVGAAESVAAELTHARRETDRLGTGRTQVTVATFTSGGRLLLPGALARLTAAHPGTVVHVREAEPEEALLLVRQSAERAGFTPEVRGTTTDYFFACSLVAAGLGVSLIPAIALTSVPPGLRVLPVAPPVPARHIGVAMPRGRGDHPYVRTLVGALRDEAAAVRTIVPPCPVI